MLDSPVEDGRWKEWEGKAKRGAKPRAFAGSLIVFWNQEDAPGIVSFFWCFVGSGGWSLGCVECGGGQDGERGTGMRLRWGKM